MREFPILFSTTMVQAIIDLLKNQTRRLKGLEIINQNPDDWNFVDILHGSIKDESEFVFRFRNNKTHENINISCPFGDPGDILWVRETWNYDPHKNVTYVYKAQGENQSEKWKPSIFMPKEACRIKLEITDRWVERLQDISNKDCIAEGITIPETGPGTLYYKEYAVLWDSINIKRASWKSNPWVWKIEFKKQ